MVYNSDIVYTLDQLLAVAGTSPFVCRSLCMPKVQKVQNCIIPTMMFPPTIPRIIESSVIGAQNSKECEIWKIFFKRSHIQYHIASYSLTDDAQVEREHEWKGPNRWFPTNHILTLKEAFVLRTQRILFLFYTVVVLSATDMPWTRQNEDRSSDV